MYFGIEQRIRNFKQYYLKANTRPLLGFFIESEYPLYRYKGSASLPENRSLLPSDFMVEEYLADNDRLFGRHEQCGGDFIFAADAFWGIPWLEAMLGCELWANHHTGSIHAEPLGETKVLDIPPFEPDCLWAKKAAEFLDALAAHSNGRYPLATTRMRGIADLLAALYGNEAFLYKMMEVPNLIHSICSSLTDLWIAFGKFQLEHIPLFHGGVGSFYYNMWAPAGSVWHQEDAAAILSPSLYDEFILPCDREIAGSFDSCFMHMHPTGFYPYKQLLDTNMTCLELHIDEGGSCAQSLFEVHKQILAKKPLLIWGKLSETDLDWIFHKLPHNGLAINVAVESSDEAKRIWNKYIGKPA